MDLILFIVLSLAIWRATHMLQDENGPGAIFARLQAAIGRIPYKPGNLNDGFFCFYCLSIWISTLVSLFVADTLLQFIGYSLALSAGAIFVNLIHNKLQQ